MNDVRLIGVVATEPRQRELPSGSFVTNLELRCETRGDPTGMTNVPVVVHHELEPYPKPKPGDRFHVEGYIARRFFRAGGVTQSRTEVVAETIRKVDP